MYLFNFKIFILTRFCLLIYLFYNQLNCVTLSPPPEPVWMYGIHFFMILYWSQDNVLSFEKCNKLCSILYVVSRKKCVVTLRKCVVTRSKFVFIQNKCVVTWFKRVVPDKPSATQVCSHLEQIRSHFKQETGI